MAVTDARRVIVYQAEDGWRWKAQGGNWRIIDRARRPVQRRARAVRNASEAHPDAEVVVR